MNPGSTNALISIDNASDPALLVALDALIEASGAALCRAGERLESIHDRLNEAAADDRRRLFAFWAPPRAALIDWQLDYPAGTDATIGVLAVDRGWRRHGIARALLEQSLRALEAEHAIADLWAGVHDDNSTARAFFEALGFEEGEQSAAVVSYRLRRSAG